MAAIILSFILLLRVNSLTGEDDIKEVLEVRTACLYHRALSFSCPEDHIVVLRRAHYLVGESDGCNTDDTHVCQIENVVSQWFTQCHRSHACEIEVREPNRTAGQCSEFQGDPFLEVTYKCEAYMGVFYETSVRDMCDFGSTFHGSLMYLWNKNFPHFSNDVDCGCTVTVDTELELNIKVPEFELTEEQSNMVTAGWCPNALDIQGGYVRKTICSLHNDTLAPVDIDIADNVYIHYRNPQQYYARIWIVLQVHYEHNFTMDCQRNFPMPSLPTLPESSIKHTTPNEDIGDKSTQNSHFEPLQQDNKSHWPIITAVVAVVCVLLVAGIAVLLFCRTRLRDKIMRQKGIVETDNFRFENSVYMNHTQVDHQSNRSSESGSQNQVYINIATASGANVATRQSDNTISNSQLPPKRENQSLPPIPDEAEDFNEGPDIIPAAVLQRLGFQSETANPEVSDNRGEVMDAEANGGDIEEQTSSRNNSVNVKDRAKLIENITPKHTV